MLSLILWVVVGLVLLVPMSPLLDRGWAAINRQSRFGADGDAPMSGAPSWIKLATRVVGCVIIVWAVASTSYVNIGPDKTGHLRKIYLGGQMPAGKIIATDGENGPQAEVLSEGFKLIPFVNIIYEVTEQSVITIPADKYGYLIAKDGLPLRPNQTFADAFAPEEMTRMVTDAAYFLTHGGQKGPQASILPPGTYRVNKFLWDVFVDVPTEIPLGYVGVVKSNVHTGVSIGNLNKNKPENCLPIKPDASKGIDASALTVPLVSVGCIGTWVEPLLPGKYYLNRHAYAVTQIDTRIQTWEYKGGYTKRTINLTVDREGAIGQEAVEEIVAQPAKAVDAAVVAKSDGSDIPLELRALIQIKPENAPFVVASVGTLEDVENDILSPVIRAIVRNVTGGMINAPTKKSDADGNLVTDAEGKLVVTYQTRPVRPLDLIENRPIIEDEIERLTRPEGLKAGIDVMEVRLGEAVIPPELLLAARRKRLAEELQLALAEEQKTQTARIATEQAKATADKQPILAEAQIQVQASEQIALARTNEGEGERNKLKAIAEGQKAQKDVLGLEATVKLRQYELLLDKAFGFANEHPEVLTAALSNAQKFVPNVSIGAGESSGIGGMLMALIGQSLDQNKGVLPAVAPALTGPVATQQ